MTHGCGWINTLPALYPVGGQLWDMLHASAQGPWSDWAPVTHSSNLLLYTPCSGFLPSVSLPHVCSHTFQNYLLSKLLALNSSWSSFWGIKTTAIRKAIKKSRNWKCWWESYFHCQPQDSVCIKQEQKSRGGGESKKPQSSQDCWGLRKGGRLSESEKLGRWK